MSRKLFEQPAVTSLDKTKNFALGKVSEITEIISIEDYETQLNTTFGIATMQSDIGTLQTNLGTAQGDITDLETAVGTAQGDITDLETAVGTAQGDISDLESDMGTAQQDIIDLQSAVGTIDPWHTVGAVDEPTFNTDWSTTNNVLSFRKSNSNTVHVTGEAYGAVGAPSLVWRLPSGYRPVATLYRTAVLYGTQTIITITIDTDGYFNISAVGGLYLSFYCDFQFRIS